MPLIDIPADPNCSRLMVLAIHHSNRPIRKLFSGLSLLAFCASLSWGH
jgi:hypothetical protein